MTSFILLAAEGGIVDNLVESARTTGEIFGVQAWLLFSQIISFTIVAFLLQRLAYKPILTVLETRRQKIAESLATAEKIKIKLAETEASIQEMLTKANADAKKMIDEARAVADGLADKRAQQAFGEAQQIITRAREATRIEREKMLIDLKREVGKLVIDTTTKVTGRVLTATDQKRIAQEAASEVTA